jgi:glycosyltransferase involved in cell wall biosynthesis
MGWEDFSLTVGVLGRFDFQKGIDVFIRAVDLFIRNNPIASDGIRFAIAGYGEEESNLRSLVFSLGLDSIISFCGCQDAEKFLPALDLCVCPSRWEGFGLVPLEAMACGVPVISTDVDSLPEVLGGAARMVPPDSPEAIAEAIAEIIGNPSLMAGMIALGRERLELFTVEKMVRAYERMYESLFA